MAKAVFISFILFFIPTLHAHNFFEGLTRISYNLETKKIEVIHRFETHDLETLVSKIEGKRVTVKRRKYSELVKQYFIKNFSISKNTISIPLHMIGVEPGEQTTVIYQEVKGVNSLLNLEISNRLLIEHFPKQLNILNYQDENVQGTLIFSKGDTETVIH